MEILALIPARSGSRGIPGKNTALLGGKPLIAYSIEAALACCEIGPQNTYCTTDSQQIADIAGQCGANILMRPAKLATDTASTTEVIAHAIGHLHSAMNKTFDTLLLLQPTSPLRNQNHIAEALRLFRENPCDSVVSVTEARQSPYLMKTVNDKGYLDDFIRNEYTRRQDMPKTMILNGAIYITSIDFFLKNMTFFAGRTLPYLMNEPESIDIDEPIDLEIARFLLEKRIQ